MVSCPMCPIQQTTQSLGEFLMDGTAEGNKPDKLDTFEDLGEIPEYTG